MWPLSSRRSSTFSMSKLGYLASRAPKAMFSRSRKTAIVASDVRAVIVPKFTLIQAAASEPRGRGALEPVVVEAHADAFGIHAIRHHFMPQPTFKEQQLARGSRKRSPGPGFALLGRLALRRRHEAIQPRILEFDAGGSGRDMHIVGAAQGRERVQMQAMHHVLRINVDPAIGHLELAPLEIPFHRIGKDLDMPF